MLCALAVSAFWLGSQADRAFGIAPVVAEAQDGQAAAGPVVADRANTIDGNTVGEVLVNEEIVIRMRTSAGGFTAPERAMIIAQRLQNWLSGSYSPYDLAVREGDYGSAQLRAAGNLIVDVNPDEANALGSSPTGLAEAWKANVQTALGVEPAPPETVADTGEQVAEDTGGEAADEQATTPAQERTVDYGSKIVPILSVGGNTRIGGARLNGPESKLDEVVACTQLETKFQDFLEIDIYVPVKTRGGLDRVQQVGVTGLGDLEL